MRSVDGSNVCRAWLTRRGGCNLKLIERLRDAVQLNSCRRSAVDASFVDLVRMDCCASHCFLNDLGRCQSIDMRQHFCVQTRLVCSELLLQNGENCIWLLLGHGQAIEGFANPRSEIGVGLILEWQQCRERCDRRMEGIVVGQHLYDGLHEDGLRRLHNFSP
jgi:hypothetical protein